MSSTAAAAPGGPPPGAEMPANYNVLRAEAVAATAAALAAGELLVELQFPAVPNMSTAALNEVLDADRAFGRWFLGAMVARLDGLRPERVTVVFPDKGEVRLAREAWGETGWRMGWIPKEGEPVGWVRGVGVGLVVILSPGFNVREWIDMEALEVEGGDPLVVINGDLDKVRGGYYPRLFYPGLWRAKVRFLSRFREVYYIKMFSNGGTLMRRYGEAWTLRYRNRDNSETTVLRTFESRPEFRLVEDLLRAERTRDLIERSR